MNRFKSLLVVYLCWLAAPLIGADQRPNVLLILSDDHNYRVLGASGNRMIRTPHLDRLAQQGVYFNRCFTPNPICMAARACIYSGQDSWANGVTFNGKKRHKNTPVLPALLAEAGYETYFGGKWHSEGKPWTNGFTTGGRCWAGGKFDQFKMTLTPFGGDNESRETADRYSSTVFTDDAVEYLKQKHEDPFCMVLAYTVGHDAFLPPPGYEGKYSAKEVLLPENFMPRPPFKQFNQKIRDETVLPFPRREQDVREALTQYYAMFEHLDAQVGRLLVTLEQQKLDKNTLVIFASVKGLSLGSHGIIGKQTMYEEGIRSTMIVRDPLRKIGQPVNSSLVSTMDIFPSIFAAAGLEVPAAVEGESFLGLYEGSKRGRQRLYFSYHDPKRDTVTRAVRTDRYKLIQHLVTGERQLFDLEQDPFEMKNLSDSPAKRELEAELISDLKRWRDEGGVEGK